MKEAKSRFYYLSEFELADNEGFSVWTPPEGTIGTIDFRNTEECSRKSGIPSSGACGIFVTNKKMVDAGLFLGQSADARIKKKEKLSLEKKLNLAKGVITGNTIADIIGQLLTEQADPTGEDRWKPLMSRCVSLCDRKEIWTGCFQKNAIWKKLFIAAKQHDFRAIYQDLLDGNCHEDHPGMVLDYWSKRHCIDAQLLVPSDIPRQDIKPHKTIIGDTFQGVDGTLIQNHTATGPNGGFTWSVVAGDGVINVPSTGINNGESVLRTNSSGFSENNFRTNGTVSGDDHYAEADYTYSSGGNHDLRVYTRFDQNSWTGYLVLAIRSSSNNTQLFKVVNGAGTLINNYSDFPSPPQQRRYKLESDGSTHTPTVDGIVFASQTDTTITGFFRAGVGGRGSGTEIDNFVFADLVNQSITSIDSPVIDGSIVNAFVPSGFSGDITSATIQSPGGDYPISVLNVTGLVTNGDFSNGTVGWDFNQLNSAVTNNSGVLRATSFVPGAFFVSHTMTGFIPGKWHRITLDHVASSLSGGVLSASIFTALDTVIVDSATTGQVILDFLATDATHTLRIGVLTTLPSSGDYFEIDNVQVNATDTFNIPDVAGFTVNTAGSPFDSASHSHTFTANLPPESASIPIVVNPKLGYQVVEVIDAVTTPGSVFEGFGAAPVDSDQVYWPTENATSVAADGTLTTGQVGGSIDMLLFNTLAGEWQPFNVTVSGSSPGTGNGAMSLLGVG
ncbi:MAG: hypothetical protein L3J21_09825 [Devosiaceae bacterium]|nr:hypothetical protein [Devosiaceae bacterium]